MIVKVFSAFKSSVWAECYIVLLGVYHAFTYCISVDFTSWTLPLLEHLLKEAFAQLFLSPPFIGYLKNIDIECFLAWKGWFYFCEMRRSIELWQAKFSVYHYQMKRLVFCFLLIVFQYDWRLYCFALQFAQAFSAYCDLWVPFDCRWQVKKFVLVRFL